MTSIAQRDRRESPQRVIAIGRSGLFPVFAGLPAGVVVKAADLLRHPAVGVVVEIADALGGGAVRVVIKAADLLSDLPIWTVEEISDLLRHASVGVVVKVPDLLRRDIAAFPRSGGEALLLRLRVGGVACVV